MLIGRSSLSNNSTKFDYLTQCKVRIGDVERNIMFKVGKHREPALFGLDTMVAWGMVADFARRRVLITDTTNEGGLPNSSFSFVKWSEILKANKIDESDLVCIEELPTAEDSYRSLVDAGEANRVVDLGTTYGAVHAHKKIITDCGSA
jgi:ABC-type nitrate/sulfonate/bicarbonate transport system substrate-binding protein